MTPDPQARPVAGLTASHWPAGYFASRSCKIHGTGFWIRPLLIEIVWAVGLPWFYYLAIERRIDGRSGHAGGTDHLESASGNLVFRTLDRDRLDVYRDVH